MFATHNTPVWVRQVIVPGWNDSEADALCLGHMLRGYANIEKIELLPSEICKTNDTRVMELMPRCPGLQALSQSSLLDVR